MLLFLYILHYLQSCYIIVLIENTMISFMAIKTRAFLTKAMKSHHFSGFLFFIVRFTVENTADILLQF